MTPAEKRLLAVVSLLVIVYGTATLVILALGAIF